jgi:2',3'-cyclic-nucleotide 2'-phosphodiesterase (5'-nucleotidase family)
MIQGTMTSILVRQFVRAMLMTGYPHLTRLLNATKFPWLLSNIVDDNTGHQPEKFLKYWITERCGVKIGVIGLVEQYVLMIARH